MKLLFTPVYSPFLNPAETIFAVSKRILRKHFSRIERELTQEGFEAEVSFVLDTMVKPNYSSKKLCNSARDEFEKALTAGEEEKKE